MYYQNEPDETLVMLTLAGEQTAYEVLVTRYQKLVISAAMKITKNHFMAEDAAQDAFVTAWMKLNTLQDAKKYASWVCRIAKNCGLNMISRYRSFLPLDTVENLNILDCGTENPAELYALSEEKDEVTKSVGKLPEKVRKIIHMHYFEALSIAEIADRMRISEGTVKWQLHDGRKRIRKELCAMNEKYNDTLVQRVMKKVEELKLWQVKNNKSGFEKVYKEVLREVEELPECTKKQHALADVLMRGWWWLPGEKNDALFARIADAAMDGKNEEVMTFIVAREDSKVYGGARIDFIRDKQIPRLEKAGLVKTLGREWFWLGNELFRAKKPEDGHAAYDKVEEILEESDTYRALVPYARRMEEVLSSRLKDTDKERYLIGGSAEDYRMIGGKLHYFSEQGFGEGWLASMNYKSAQIFRNASCCDGQFFADIAVGETHTGTDGTTLSYISDSVFADTPTGRFEGCQLWEVRRWTDTQKIVCRTYYKDSVGIVLQELTADGVTDSRALAAYEIKGGDGVLPLFQGNRWEYVYSGDHDVISSGLEVTVAFADADRILVAYFEDTERLKYDENSWIDTVQEIANEYARESGGNWRICDVYPAIERAEKLAVTPMEKTHTKAAASAARRILATDPTFTPDHTATGHWNFFCRTYIRKKSDSLVLTDYNSRWCFEWKNTGSMGAAEDPILFNDIYGILRDATNCLWSDEWRIGVSPIVEYDRYDHAIKTQIICEDGGTVTTKAGTFENCFKLCLDIGGMEDGWSYRGGKKVYYFAEGIGIVRTENEYCGGARTAVYELTSYEGIGEGFMPIGDGMVRRYDALDMTDGFVGAVEYTYVADEDGDIVLFSDQIGIRELPPIITQYSAIQGERIEEQLCDSGKWKEGQLMYGVNNFHLILHLLGRPSHNIHTAKRSVEVQTFNMKLMELLGENGEVPPAWYSLYSWTALIRSAALFGSGEKDEGYRSLETAIEYAEKAAIFKKGELLDTGNSHVLGGVKYVKECGRIQLPNGKSEPINYDYRMYSYDKLIFDVLNRPNGWEWFNSVRSEDRFKEYIERADKIGTKK